jgi:hypothetical protein
MGSFKNTRLLALALVSAAVVPGALVMACSSDNANPVPPVYPLNDGSANPQDTGIQGEDSSSPGEDASADGGDARAIIPEDAAACTLAHLPATGAPVSSCWNAADLVNCVPQKDLEFANQCAGTGVTCAPFDNKSRLPGYDGGPLPSYN